ncbi:BEL1-like homeodomain protein 7 [Macadamia integrifolia]|uniref:BEL1-like homeodomain protein 7 n=1 Tax=Macadamia integrifolia TaxID=60698 RepID=UPI001C4FADEA|nr:BEL1-like homeodomain protein 7 [Macadamia integrifolia]XP_042494424.1 BEL1-like homeodomain protein 7 [Macadamia integrifolia]XP_042494425.1 BEL1-like homeodomain protein 7 [Macadamia integrifolia]
MATYFPGSSNQREGMPTLYARDPVTTTSYAEASVLPGNMMMYLNYSESLAGNSQPQQNCVELPSVGTSGSTATQQGSFSNLMSSHLGDQQQQFGVWRDGRNEMMFMRPAGGSTSMQSLGEDSQVGLQTQLGILHGGQNLQGQGLSLSLSTQIPSTIPVPPFQYRNSNPGFSSLLNSSHPSMSGDGGSGTSSSKDDESSQGKQQLRDAEYLPPGFSGANRDDIKGEALNNFQYSMGPKLMHSDPSPYGLTGLANTIPNSKYLKAVQQLLDEVVNVHKALKQSESDKHQKFHGSGLKDPKETEGESNDGTQLLTTSGTSSKPQESGTNNAELSPAERQDLQNKMTKLLSMLDEVDRRYKQYYYQMQIVVSSFDVIAGCGAAKPYTALALQTISRHFRCLHDAISGQIQATRKSLGEQDSSANSKGVGISRLRYVDHQLKQQRALQQLGMMQQHAWRPQRGLPESSVSILRAWLFEHFLHPYPKDSDKILLARQTGLTRSQVSNWFINARVRLWKPMVEEMYKEETGDTEINSNSSSENAPKVVRDDNEAPEDKGEDFQQTVKSAATDRCHPETFHDSKSNLVPDIEMSGPEAEAAFQDDTHKGDDDTDYGGMKLREDQRPSLDDCSLFQDALVQSDRSGGVRFMGASAAYEMAELGRFGSSSGVSLTLGLQHCDGSGLPMSGGTPHNFITLRGDEMYNAVATSGGPDTADYERHRFSSSHLFHDFVA